MRGREAPLLWRSGAGQLHHRPQSHWTMPPIVPSSQHPEPRQTDMPSIPELRPLTSTPLNHQSKRTPFSANSPATPLAKAHRLSPSEDDPPTQHTLCT